MKTKINLQSNSLPEKRKELFLFSSLFLKHILSFKQISVCVCVRAFYSALVSSS